MRRSCSAQLPLHTHIARAAVSAGLAVSMMAAPIAPAIQAVAATGVETQAKVFSDVDYGSWYASSVDFCAENAVMGGYGGTTRFGVGDPLTTEQVAAILWNIAEPDHGVGETANTTGKSDVLPNQWYTGACDWAKANGVINGYAGTDRFGVGEHITAERLAAILYNFTGQTSASTSELSAFTDQGDVSSWARAACAWAKRAGLVNGYPDGTLRPKEEIKRERVAAILKNAVDASVIKLGDTSTNDSKDTPAPTPTATTYSIAFVGNGATSGTTAGMSVETSKSVTLTANGYSRTGYTFKGWSTSKTATSATYADKANVKDLASAGKTVTLYAVWSPITYKVAINANGGSGGTSINATYDKDITLSATLTRSGYTLTGLNTRNDGKGTTYKLSGTVKNLSSTNGATVTLYAQWEKNALPKVTFSGATVSATVSEDGSVTLPSATKTGYTLSGWKAGSTTYKAGDKVKLTSDTTFVAQWTAIAYKVAFDANGGTGSMVSQDMTYDKSAALTANTLTQDGYDFNGWNTQADGKGTSYADKAAVSNLTAASNGTVTLYAQWKARPYTVHFDGNGSTSGSTADVSGSGTVTLASNGFARTNYTFVGWNTQADGKGTAYAASSSAIDLAKPGKTITLYAQWKSNVELAQEKVDAAHAKIRSAIEAKGGDYDAYMKGSVGFFQSVNNQDAIDVINHTGYSNTDANGESFTSFTHVGNISDATSLYNVNRGIDIVRGLNKKRGEWNTEYASEIAAGSKSELGEVYVTDMMMAITEDHTNWSSEHIRQHAANYGSPYQKGENLAWGYRDPFVGWYDEEKVIYDRGTDEEGHYEGVVGHYVNCITDYSVAGGAWNSESGTSGLDLCRTGGVVIKADGRRVNCGTPYYSVADYQSRFDAYYSKVTGGADLDELESEAASAELALRDAKVAAGQE